MDRRDFLKTTGNLIAGATVVSGLPAAGYASNRPTQRAVWCCHQPQLALQPKATPAARARDFDDSGFTASRASHQYPGAMAQLRRDPTSLSPSIAAASACPPKPRPARHVDFEGVMTASTVWLNGVRLGEYKGGFTPFPLNSPSRGLRWRKPPAVEVDSTSARYSSLRYIVDYLTFGGIYREVSLRIVSPPSSRTFCSAQRPLSDHPTVDVQCWLVSERKSPEIG